MKESIWHEREFDPDAEYTVNKPMTHAGETFERGDKFDKTTASPRNLRIMFERRFLVKVPSDQVAESPPPPPVPAAAVIPEEDRVEESGSVDGSTADPDVSAFEVVPRPRAPGWFDVVDGKGNILNEKSLRVDEAKKFKEEKTHELDVRRGPGEQ